MDEESRGLGCLENICVYCERITDAVQKFGSRDAFMNDYVYQAACAFSLLQIGELVKTNYAWLRKVSPKFPWTQYIRFRDFAAHNYETVNNGLLWEGVVTDVEPIREEASRILKFYENRSQETVSKNRKPKRFRLFRRRFC